MEYDDVRVEMENQGIKLTDDEFKEQIRYAERKAKLAGYDEIFIPLLLWDVCKEYATFRVMRDYYSVDRMTKREDI